MFTKADLKSGMVVTLRNGNNAFAMLDTGVMDNDFLVFGDGSRMLHLNDYSDSLTYARTALSTKDFDIVKVEQDTYCLELLQKCGHDKKTVFDREKGIGCEKPKSEYKFEIGDKVKVFDRGKECTDYDEFVSANAPKYVPNFIGGGQLNAASSFRVVGRGENNYNTYRNCYVIQDDISLQVFVVCENGLKVVEE